MSARRNIVLSLDEEMLREARVLAARRGLSVSEFLKLQLTELVEKQRRFERAKALAVKRLERGQAPGRAGLSKRDVLHDREALRRNRSPRGSERPTKRK